MKTIVPGVLLFLTAGCTHLEQRSEEKEIGPRKVGANYHFKTWPGSPTTYILNLSGVKTTSATLGPDFSVHYFSFEPEASLALYNGNNPKGREGKAESQFDLPFGKTRAQWSCSRRDAEVRAEAYVPAADHSVWHVIVIAPTEERVKEVIEQLGSFGQEEKHSKAERRGHCTERRDCAAVSIGALSARRR